MPTRVLIIVAVVVLAGCAGDESPSASPSETTAAEATASAPTTPSAAPTAPPTVTEAAADPTDEATTAPPADDTTEPATAAGTSVVEAWYVRTSGGHAFVEPERRQLASPTVGVARAALTEVIEETPRDPGLTTLAPDGTRVLGVNRNDSVIILDVSGEIDRSGAGSAQEEAFAQQLAHTVTQFDGVRSVRLLVDGERITELWGHLDWSRPIRPDKFAVSQVIVTTPRHGATVAAGSVTTAGTANVYEATVVLTLRNPNDKVHKRTFTTATCGTGCRGTWEHTFQGVTTPGTWTLIAAATDPSDGEGNPPFKVRRTFTVR